MIVKAFSVWAVWSLRITLVISLEKNACLLPVTQPDQLFLGAPGGSAESLGEVAAADYQQCIDQCCNGTEGLCNVAIYFKPDLPEDDDDEEEDLNCLLYQCRPLASCSFNSDEEYEIFAEARFVRENTAETSTNRPWGTTEPGKSGSNIYNTTHSLDDGLPEGVDNSTENETGITKGVLTQAPTADNITQPSANSSEVYSNGTQGQKYDITLVPEGNASLTQNITSSLANGQTSENSNTSTAHSQVTSSTYEDQQQAAGGNVTRVMSLNITAQNVTTTRPVTPVQSLPTTPPVDDVHDASQQQDNDIDESSRITSMSVLIAALSVGCLFFVAAVALVAKRCHDSWKKRHYSRVEYLVEGMYHE